ncbi:MAG: Yip1 family protein [Candidatus Hydrothermarchaeales archaeon]
MTAIENIKGVITAPGATFKSIKEGDHKLIIPLDIIIGIGIVRGIVDFLQRPKMLEILSNLGSITEAEGFTSFQEQILSEAAGVQNITIFDAVSSGVISAIFGWLFLVMVYFIISRILSGSASLKDLLEVTGYARVPELLGTILALFLASLNPFFILFLMLIFTLWARVLDIFAIKEANDFTMGRPWPQ